MFEESAWESDRQTDKLTVGLCQKYEPPKQNKANKRKSKKPQSIKIIASEGEDILKLKGIKKKKTKLVSNQSESSQTEKEIRKSRREIGNQISQQDSNVKKTLKANKRNKYKKLAHKIKDVGKDTREVCPLVDIPRKLKFTGGNNADHISQWQIQKQDKTNATPLKKKKKHNKKAKDCVVSPVKSDSTISQPAIPKDNTTKKENKIEKLEKLMQNKHKKIEDNQDIENVEENVNKTIKSKKNKRNLEHDIHEKGSAEEKNTIKRPKRETEEDNTEEKPIGRQNKKEKRNKYKDIGKNVQMNLLQQSSEKVVIKSYDENVFNEESSLPKNIPKFNIETLKTILSDDSLLQQRSKSPEVKKNKKEKVKQKKNVPLREKLQDRLNAARFRYLNEVLYTQTGDEAHKLFQGDPQSFLCYHTGFQNQVVKWSKNPVDIAIDYVKSRPTHLTVADFGCGEAKIAQSVKNKVFSFDLVAINEYVTACDMSHVPLKPESIDIAVFCLSLMGTNLVQYLCEASRVLKNGGTMLIAEVTSRFEKVGGFVRKVEKLGFNVENRDQSSKMFMWFEFKKTGKPPVSERIPGIELAPCVYKKR